jgi:hypothetical protein
MINGDDLPPQGDSTETYWIAVKRESRDEAPSDWRDQLTRVQGLQILSRPGSERVRVVATEQAIREAITLVGDFCHVERSTGRNPILG